jgi:hypothetical protein
MLLITNFLELDVVAAGVISWQVANMPSPCHGLERSLTERHISGMAGERHGNGMACVNQTRPHYVNQIGKTQSNDLAERHGRGTAWERHGMCDSALRHSVQVSICNFTVTGIAKCLCDPLALLVCRAEM